MSQGGYSHVTRANGTVLTAAIYNNDHQNHITNQNPQMTGGYSDTLAQMQTMTSPGGLGSEVLATTLQGEIERIRYQLRAITGTTQWYMPPPQSLSSIGGIGDGSVALTKLTNTTQGKLMGRVSAGTGAWQEFDIPSLTALAPAPGDFVMGVPAAGGAPRKIDVQNIGGAGGFVPQGRLTLTAGTPVMGTTTTAQNTIRYTPYHGLLVPNYNGTTVVPVSMGAELSQLTTDNTKSPAPCAANSNYDLFFWLDGATPRISRGPPWSSDTSRGTGAGTAEVTRVSGLLVNAQAITNGPAQYRGTYLGTIRTNAAALVDWNLGAQAAGGTAGILGVWNMYHRTKIGCKVQETANSWVVPANADRPYNNSQNHRVSLIRGFQEDIVETSLNSRGITPNNGFVGAYISWNSITNSGRMVGTFLSVSSSSGGNVDLGAAIALTHFPTLGWHYYQAMEWCSNNATSQLYGSTYFSLDVGQMC